MFRTRSELHKTNSRNTIPMFHKGLGIQNLLTSKCIPSSSPNFFKFPRHLYKWQVHTLHNSCLSLCYLTESCNVYFHQNVVLIVLYLPPHETAIKWCFVRSILLDKRSFENTLLIPIPVFQDILYSKTNYRYFKFK